MKICFVLDDSIYRWGGAQTYVLGLAKILTKFSHEVTILTSENSSVAKRELNFRIIEVSKGFDIKSFSLNGSFSPFPGFANKRNLKEILEKENFDILHLNYPFSPFVSGRIIKILSKLKEQKVVKTKLIATFHIHVEEKLIPKIGNYILAFFQKKIIKNIDKFIHISKATQEYAKKYLKVTSEYIPVGVESREVKKDFSKKINILFFSRLEERKGVLDFIEALNLLKERNLLFNTEINIAGDGPDREKAEELSRNYNLNIKFHGKVSEEVKSNLYKEANLSVCTAKFGESFGIILLEAMNYSCAIAGYRNAGYEDTMQDFANKTLVEVGNIQDLANLIESFIKNREETKNLSFELKSFFEKRYSLEEVGKSIEKLYLD